MREFSLLRLVAAVIVVVASALSFPHLLSDFFDHGAVDNITCWKKEPVPSLNTAKEKDTQILDIFEI